MRLRTLGSSGPELSAIGFGAWEAGSGEEWGAARPDQQAIDAMHAGLDAGMNWIDTAEVYGKGVSERIVGRAVQDRRDQALVTPSNRGESSASGASSGWMLRHTVRHVVPSCRARPWTEACSARHCPIAHQHARIVNKPRGRQIRSSCSVNDLPDQTASRHRHVRFRHNTRTGRPKHGASTNTTVRRPPLVAITPHTGQPAGAGGDSTVTVKRSAPSTTLMTCRPGRPTSRSQRSQ
jgi:hypothetical protein